MTSHYRHRRTNAPATAFPSPVEPGEIVVNSANRQLVVGDADAAALGTPLLLLAVRYFDPRAQYAAGDFVVQGGALYRAKVAVAPNPFNVSQWDLYSSDSQLPSGVTQAYVDAGDALKVAKAGDTMTGALNLSGLPTVNAHAASKQYVDQQDALAPTKTYIDAQDALKVAKNGDTMTGNLTISKGAPSLTLNTAAIAGDQSIIYGSKAAINRWALLLGDASPESGGNTGSSFGVACFDDAGNFLGSGFTINRNDNLAIVKGDPTAPLGVATKQYVDTRVRYDAAQSLTAPQQQQARQNIYAAPFDALAYNGLQINGSGDVDQTLVGNVQAAGTEGYFTDGWTIATGGAVNALASTYTPLAFTGFPNCLRFYNITAIAALAAADYGFLRTRIEGYRCMRLSWGNGFALPITIGFWLNGPVGTVTVFVQNAAGDRSYVVDVASSGSGNWEYKTVTIPGCTDGTWNTANGVGLSVGFCVGCGTTKQGTNKTWNAKQAFGTAQTSNFCAVSGALFGVTGLTVLPGSEAPSAARSPFIMRPFDNELVLCQRYFQKSWDYGTAPGTPWAGGSDQFVFSHPTAQFATTVQFIPKRAIPTLTTYDSGGNPGVVSAYTSGWTNGAAIAVMGVRDKQFFIQVNIATSIYTNFGFKLDARL